ncbi:STAS domain-containing protein [Pleionea sp. CnH1-48]|uniref:STAS domain-containing protein n=1 Tax=Pleionea sp. CnH1-48 TaxID=2954494 RepID=UPI00209718C5|nr:STAS domain-containing protein [Pleionea sp. CnH1-48]
MGNKVSVSCGSHLDIQHANALKERLVKALEKNPESFVINGGKVERTDSAGVQLLFSFIREARQKDIDISWQKPSEELLRGVQILGMLESLELQSFYGELR